jgi:hypothetical protein
MLSEYYSRFVLAWHYLDIERCVLVNIWVRRKGNDRVVLTRELFLVGSVEHAPYSCLFAMAGYCVVLPVRIEGKGSGESPCALIPT